MLDKCKCGVLWGGVCKAKAERSGAHCKVEDCETAPPWKAALFQAKQLLHFPLIKDKEPLVRMNCTSPVMSSQFTSNACPDQPVSTAALSNVSFGVLQTLMDRERQFHFRLPVNHFGIFLLMCQIFLGVRNFHLHANEGEGQKPLITVQWRPA